MEFEIFKAGVYSMYDRQNNRIPLLYTRTTSSRGRWPKKRNSQLEMELSIFVSKEAFSEQVSASVNDSASCNKESGVYQKYKLSNPLHKKVNFSHVLKALLMVVSKMWKSVFST